LDLADSDCTQAEYCAQFASIEYAFDPNVAATECEGDTAGDWSATMTTVDVKQSTRPLILGRRL